MSEWEKVERPGYFGRRKAEKIKALDEKYGAGNWNLMWNFNVSRLNFIEACVILYEASYIKFLSDHPGFLNLICSYGECIDNDMSNIASGLDYKIQESWATHIQDIAVRNALKELGREFEGPKDKILVIRSADSNGFRFNPGNVPFIRPDLIEQPSIRPKWAQEGSVEDFWQSNKWIYVKKN